jgi:UDP-N-acetylglucosamine--N-acetylmuramyl-(pentapeptide) pyrophosphoryl-undecaprenol N-acetylglucosamine transferase
MKSNKNINKKILVTGGGTGGHVVPLMAVVDELKKKKAQILYVGSGNQIEKDLAKERKIDYKVISTGKWRRYFDLNNFIDIFKVVIGFIQSFFIILSFRPDVIFSKGGYVGLPVVYAASVLGKKIYIHETDSVLGLANKKSIDKCVKIFTGYPPKYYPEIPASKIVYTGNPIRDDFRQVKKKKIFTNNKKTILITGGSQGARFINQTIAKILPDLTQKYNIIHISGKIDFEWLSKNKKDWKNYKLLEFALPRDFAGFMKSSDLVVSRAGGTIAEIAYCGKPAIIIPLPTSANAHQEKNAEILEKENSAIVVSYYYLSFVIVC